MSSRRGFTLPEVLVTMVVLAIALAGVMSVSTAVLKKSSNPDRMQQAALIAADRLAYFRGQVDPFRSVGGTWYQPPLKKGDTDYNTPTNKQYHNADANFNCNNAPRLFAREMLYDASLGQLDQTGVDQGVARNRRQLVPGKSYYYNQVPDTSPTYARILPAVDDVAAVPAVNPTSLAFPGLTVPWKGPAGDGKNVGRAQRANDHLREGVVLDDNVAGETIKYVREVWVQTNQPKFDLGTAISPFAPTIQPALPPWTVAVTVRVFYRDRKVRKYHVKGTPPLSYDQTKPIAEATGYFGLVRKLVDE